MPHIGVVKGTVVDIEEFPASQTEDERIGRIVGIIEEVDAYNLRRCIRWNACRVGRITSAVKLCCIINIVGGW